MTTCAYLGHGVGLRTEHYTDVVDGSPAIDWFEVITENFLVEGGNPRRVLRSVRERYPVVLHGVSLSIGSTDPLDERYLDRLSALADEIEPAWISDHLCWNSLGGHRGHDLWPLPYTEQALVHVSERVQRAQDRLGRRILLENVSSYVGFAASVIPEWEFCSELARRADCLLLLDINNVYVSAHNHGFDPYRYLEAIPRDRVGQFHLAGHSDQGVYLLDSHDHPVCDEVWALYRAALGRFGRTSTLIEWDDRVPALDEVVQQARCAAEIERAVLGEDTETGSRRDVA